MRRWRCVMLDGLTLPAYLQPLTSLTVEAEDEAAARTAGAVIVGWLDGDDPFAYVAPEGS